MQFNTILQLHEHFADEGTCRAHLATLRWGKDGVASCPLCGVVDAYAIEGWAAPATEDRTPHERDLPSGERHVQGLIVGRPHEPGRYRVEVELEVAGRPTGIRTSFVAEARRFGL